MKKIFQVLYLSYDGLTDSLGQSQVLPYIAGLSNGDYQFTVISFEKKAAFTNHHKLIQSICHERQIQWIPLPYHKSPPVVSTLFDILKLWIEVKKTFRKKDISIIHCRSYITSLVGMRAKKKWGAKFIFDMRGYWADERVEGGLWNLRNPMYSAVYRFFKNRERVFLENADQIITLTTKAKEYIISNFQIAPNKLTIIRCCVDTDLFNTNETPAVEQRKLKGKLGIDPEDFVLLYLGSIGTWYLLDEMFLFFNALSEERLNSKFLIVTTDAEEGILKVAKNRQVDLRKIVITKAEREKVPLYISIAHAGILFIKPTFSKQASFPTKLPEILAMGIPIVANNIGDNEILFKSENIGSLVNSFDLNSYRDSIKKIVHFSNPDRLRNFTLTNFSLSDGILLYRGVYRDVVNHF